MKKRILLSGMMAAFLFSCEVVDENTLNVPQESARIESNFVSQDYAEAIAATYAGFYVPHGDELVTRAVEVRKVKETIPVYNESGTNVYYIVNLEGGGFRVVSADNRLQPILASSEEGSMTNESIGEIPGLQMWVDGMIQHVTDVKASNDTLQADIIKALWRDVNPINPISRVSSGTPDCSFAGQSIYETLDLGAQIYSRWHQGDGYNDMLAQAGCPPPEDDEEVIVPHYNGRYPLGCTTIAAGLAMRYNEKPSTFNWADMPWTEPTTTTASFLAELSRKIGVIYDCDGTEGSISDVCNALKSYGYNNVSVVNYTQSVMQAQISANGLVIMRGNKPSEQVGHEWIVSGVRQTTYYRCDETPYGTLVKTHVMTMEKMYHIDWGFNGDSNGWYTEDGFLFPDNKQMIINIY